MLRSAGFKEGNGGKNNNESVLSRERNLQNEDKVRGSHARVDTQSKWYAVVWYKYIGEKARLPQMSRLVAAELRDGSGLTWTSPYYCTSVIREESLTSNLKCRDGVCLRNTAGSTGEERSSWRLDKWVCIKGAKGSVGRGDNVLWNCESAVIEPRRVKTGCGQGARTLRSSYLVYLQ